MGASYGGLVKSFHVTSNAVQQVSAVAGSIRGYFLDNSANAATSYYQFFNKLAANVTLGTTVADFVLPVPANLAANLDFELCDFAALSFAVTTTYNGSTAPASAVDPTIFYT